MKFKDKLAKIVQKNDSILCVGLDIDAEKMPPFLFKKYENPYFEFNRKIVDNTKDLVCAYKLNMGFYETLGKEGWDLLEKTIRYIPENIIVILDGKRNDIGNTAKKYANSLFETLKADAATVNPYLGFDGVKPFLDYKDKCTFILCKTSNASAADFQDLNIGKTPLYQVVAEKIKLWNECENSGAIVGATYPSELEITRRILGDNIPLLIPGIGAQGGVIEKTVRYGTNNDGEMAIINSSRGIIYAGKNENYAQKSREVAVSLNRQINSFR